MCLIENRLPISANSAHLIKLRCGNMDSSLFPLFALPPPPSAVKPVHAPSSGPASHCLRLSSFFHRRRRKLRPTRQRSSSHVRRRALISNRVQREAQSVAWRTCGIPPFHHHSHSAAYVFHLSPSTTILTLQHSHPHRHSHFSHLAASH